jgi:hypothetical protein
MLLQLLIFVTVQFPHTSLTMRKGSHMDLMEDLGCYMTIQVHITVDKV